MMENSDPIECPTHQNTNSAGFRNRSLSDRGTEGRRRFERSRFLSKPESFDIPEEAKSCQPVDNVFSSVGARKTSSLLYQRSVSMPAKLPDVVPGSADQEMEPDHVCPDVLSRKNSAGDTSLSSACSTRMQEEHARKLSFEGTVHTGNVAMRKKSVTFVEGDLNDLKESKRMSDKGMEGRSHFRHSSGYGSGGSQVSQQSTGSSMHDDVYDDGSTDDDDKETPGSDPTALPAQLQSSDSDSASASPSPGIRVATEHAPPNPEYLEWSKEMNPQVNFTENLPCLSIFDTSLTNSHVAAGEFSDTRIFAADVVTTKDESVKVQSGYPLPSETERQNAPSAESPVQRTSPTTKEECQRDLLRRIFEEKMLNFNNDTESMSDLFEWIKNNIGDALTPSPRSPFFPVKSPYSLKIPEGLSQNMIQLGVDPSKLRVNHPVTHLLPPTMTQLHQVTARNLTPAGHNPHLNNAAAGPDPAHQQPACNQHTLAAEKQHWGHVRDLGANFTREDPGAAHAGNWPLSAAVSKAGLPTVLDEAQSLVIGGEPWSSVNVLSGDLTSSLPVANLDHLVNMCQCTCLACPHQPCAQMKLSLWNLKEALKFSVSDATGEDLRTVKLLAEHNASCEHINCPVPWCRYMSYHWKEDRKSMERRLMTLLTNPLHYFLPADVHFDKFFKLDPSLALDTRPVEWEHWLTVCPLSSTLAVVRALPVFNTWPRKYWVMKMTSLHEGSNQAQVLRKLGRAGHRHIAQHVWFAVSHSHDMLLLCTDFVEGVSVRDFLDQRHLTPAIAQLFWKQVLTAVQHLHNLNIVFLNWACSNVLVDQKGHQVKVTNFTTSVDLSSKNADLGSVKMNLPADVVPPELHEEDRVCLKSDSWGLGCVLQEMLTGCRPFSNWLHHRQDTIWRQVCSQEPLPLPEDLPQWSKGMISGCLKKCPDSRLSVPELQHRILGGDNEA